MASGTSLAADRFVEAARGVRLRVRVQGATLPGTPLLVLHGFTGRVESMADVGRAFSTGSRARPVVAVDLVGHGESDSPPDPTAYSMASCVAQVTAVLDALALSRVQLLGYSMGGRVALSLAVAHPARVASLVLVGASPGLADADAREARVAADEALARRILDRGLERFVDEWMALPLFASQARRGAAALAAERAWRLRGSAEGLAGSLRGMGTGAMPPLHERLGEIAQPVLLVAGALDEKFAEIARQMQPRLPRAQCALVENAGHAAHWEEPARFAESVAGFLDGVESGPHPQPKQEERTMTASEDRPGGPVETKQIPGASWKPVREYRDIAFDIDGEGIARITICRPHVRNAFRPETTAELIDAFARVREMPDVGVVLLTGQGDLAFCSGGDQSVRSDAGYVGGDGVPRLNVLDLQKSIRSLPKPVVALVAGYAIGGGHVLHVVCDLTIAAENARFGQTGARVGSFDGGFGASYLARHVGQKKAREIWFLCRQYDAREALDMGLVNAVVPLEELEREGVAWAKQMLQHSPLAIRCLKASFNAELDGQAGIQELAGNATLLFYMNEEAQEGRDAYNQKREPDFSRFPWRP